MRKKSLQKTAKNLGEIGAKDYLFLKREIKIYTENEKIFEQFNF